MVSDGDRTVVVAVPAVGCPGGEVAVFVIVPAEPAVTVTVATADPPAVIDPSEQVTVTVPEQPPGAVAETKVAPGNVSATSTPVAVEEPVFVTVIVYVTFSPACTGSGDPVTVVTSEFLCFVSTRISSIT